MSVITDACLSLMQEFSEPFDKEDFLAELASKRLKHLYKLQSDDLDNVIKSLDNYTDYDDIETLSYIIKKLNKCLNSNRDQLLNIIERVR